MKVRCRYGFECKYFDKYRRIHCAPHEEQKPACEACFHVKIKCGYKGESECITEFEYEVLKAAYEDKNN